MALPRFIALYLVGAICLFLGAAIGVALDRLPPGSIGSQLAVARGELDGVRVDLELARGRSVELERRIIEAKGLATSSAERVESAVLASGRIADSGQRIAVLVDALRAVGRNIRDLVKKMGAGP
jgi:hypothetical protein